MGHPRWWVLLQSMSALKADWCPYFRGRKMWSPLQPDEVQPVSRPGERVCVGTGHQEGLLASQSTTGLELGWKLLGQQRKPRGSRLMWA